MDSPQPGTPRQWGGGRPQRVTPGGIFEAS
jgi:hypothetical protein